MSQGRDYDTRSGPSTTQPSPTSTVFQPGADLDSPSTTNIQSGLASKIPDEERNFGSGAGPSKDDENEKVNKGRETEPKSKRGPSDEKGQDQDFVVKWDGPDDPGCPLNTPSWRKW